MISFLKPTLFKGKNMKTKAFIYIILAGIFWGTSGIFVHYLSPIGLSSMHLTAIRGFVAAVIMIIYTFLKNKSLFKISIKQLIFLIFTGVAMFLTAFCYYSSMKASSVSTAVILMYTSSIFVLIYSVLFLGEKMTMLKGLSIVLMIIGAGLVSGIVGGLKFNFIGIILGLLSGITYSVYSVISKILMNNGCNPQTLSTYCFTFMALIAITISKPNEIITIAANNPKYILLMIGCGICSFVLPYFLYTLSLKHLPAGTASSLSIVEPLAATLFSVTLLGEKLNIYSSIGIILISSSVVMLSKTDE